jgi:hypothetical protein
VGAFGTRLDAAHGVAAACRQPQWVSACVGLTWRRPAGSGLSSFRSHIWRVSLTRGGGQLRLEHRRNEGRSPHMSLLCLRSAHRPPQELPPSSCELLAARSLLRSFVVWFSCAPLGIEHCCLQLLSRSAFSTRISDPTQDRFLCGSGEFGAVDQRSVASTSMSMGASLR